MKNKMLKKISLALSVVLVLLFAMTGCSENLSRENNSGSQNNGTVSNNNGFQADSDDSYSDNTPTATELEVRFGDDGESFVMHLYDNDTAAAIARHVGTADWRLPIYNYDNYENWEVMQYYDIPSRYDIPSNPENITAEKAGEVYYSEPNRIVLFYGDAEVSGEYTKVGYFDVTDEFIAAVENNPVLEGWGNKIVLISSAD